MQKEETLKTIKTIQECIGIMWSHKCDSSEDTGYIRGVCDVAGGYIEKLINDINAEEEF